MNESKLCTIEQIEQFLNASAAVAFTAHDADDTQRYAHISRVPKRFDYKHCNRHDRGVLLRYLQHTSGYSRAQITRLVKQWHTNRLATVPLVKRYGAPAAPFKRKYTPLDIERLVEMDKAHEDVCGPAIIHLFKRAFHDYGDARYERLASLSCSHLYNLRKSVGYRSLRMSFTKTHPVCNTIGVRKAPCPDGRAGFVRIDSVHQGDEDGMKGVYHITCVDSISQWQVEACVQGISEAFLLPVLELVIAQFPFVVEGFHSDNGSEYINHKVARMLEKLRIEQTKSRSRQSNDNALAESKNASVVGIEVIDSRYRDFKFDLKSVVADNTSAVRFVVGGQPMGVSGVDLRTVGIVLEKNGLPVAFGAGAAVLGHPAAAIAMLANHLGARGECIPAGSLILSGGITEAVSVQAGDNVTLRVQGMGSTSLRFV